MSEHDQDQSIQGRTLECGDEQKLRMAVEAAFDYRGDVTLELNDGTQVVGYLYDRHFEHPPARVRVIPNPGRQGQSASRVTIEARRIMRIIFSGRDTAEGKTWENWMKRYAEKKLAGERADIEPDPGH
ncbi:MAG: hypothetical protein JJU36_14115 [Phycisphaeraceae bacterium]|nr:hypothetical protein [Phycisphaeraceae bacterium]